MFGVLPERIAHDQLLAAGGRLTGTVPLGSLARLASLLPQIQAEGRFVKADLKLEQDQQGWTRLQGRLEAGLDLICERCQANMPWPLEVPVDVYLVRSESERERLADDADFIVTGESIALHELVEDELILALPLVAKHPQGTECGNRALQGPVAESGVRDNPFAILEKLKV